jgi:serine/threonine-protein kinase
VVGTTIGNYVVRRKIGQGGMGAVYLAEHPRIGRQVAIKVLLPEVSRKPDVVQRFFTEARASSEIRNEHIIDILDFGELPDGTSYIIMEWLDGRSLRDLIAAGPLELGRALHIARGIGRALAAAHARGIVHRDLKPDNIFLIRRGGDPDFVKVLDFGIAKLMQPGAGDEHHLTKTGALIGTPSYMSPEQCRGQPVDHRTDIYALGVILYQMLSGRLPFVAHALGELLLAHMTQQPPPLHGLPPRVDEAILRALEKDPAKRFQHVEAMVAQLGESSPPNPVVPAAPSPGALVWAGAPTLARAPSSDTLGAAAGEAAPSTVASGRRKPLLLVASAALLLAGGAGLLLFRQQSPKPAPPPPRSVALAPPATVANPATIPPATARVSIRATPPSAQLLLDDAPVPNPFTGQFPRGDLRHRLVVKAPGYRSEARWIAFDADRDLDIALVKGAGGAATTDTKSPPIYKGTKGKLITEFPEN